ncbi:MAG: Sjogren's syndrome/scleroderma autoantigen 1 family protein [Methermicoccaceae archaeon]
MTHTDDRQAKLDRISWMLEHGGTMLAQHCERCGSPLFRYRGRVLCPVCSTEGDEQDEPPQKPSAPEPAIPERDSPREHEDTTARDGSAVDVVEQKIDELAYSLQFENDPRRIGEILDAIRKAAETLKVLKG